MGRSTGYIGRNALKRAGWWLSFLVCALYASYALYMGVVEILHQLGLVTDAPLRAVPVVFVIHALAGSVALVSGPLQFNRRLRDRSTRLHRLLGRTYVATVWLASISGLWSAMFFQVTPAAKIAFGLLSILWFGSTTIALLRIVSRDIAAHREWMIRSFSLSLFFLGFSFWVPGLASTGLPDAVGYPLAVFLSWSVNLAAAELWLRRTRSHLPESSRSTTREYALQTLN